MVKNLNLEGGDRAIVNERFNSPTFFFKRQNKFIDFKTNFSCKYSNDTLSFLNNGQ